MVKKDNQKFRYIEIDLSEITLNKENPRFEKAFSQAETIQKVIENQGFKLARLAEHIIDNGFNPSDILIVIPKGKKFFVKEGNRRIVSLMLVKDPNLIFSNEALKNKFLLLKSQKEHLLPKKVFCVVFEKNHDPDEWISLKHAVDQKGVGTEKWNSQQTNRFARGSVEDLPIELQAIEILKKHKKTSKDVISQIPDLKATNLRRLLSDPYVKGKIGLEIDNKKLKLLNPEEEALNNLESVIRKISEKSFAVKDIYQKKDRKKFIRSMKLKKIKISKKPILIKAKKAEKKYTSLINPNQKLSSAIGAKILKIYKELQSVSADMAPHATAFLLRCLIEISVKRYLKKKGGIINPMGHLIVVTSGRRATYDSLRKKINYISRTYITDSDLRSSVVLLNKNSFTRSLNQFIHNEVHQATPTKLRDFWTNAENLFKFLIS